ncbi:ATP-binding protein [Christiangramia crocea]|uniref:ATP-binding protein n=1 Tax=Christiangramia crocea TaxID=2904124 RepID=A0A9X1UYF5_9FLAO|nr:ATP-binding protein [Gramella crocea]MCG9972578.1 ATP-binding protein [Gramella crocea]
MDKKRLNIAESIQRLTNILESRLKAEGFTEYFDKELEDLLLTIALMPHLKPDYFTRIIQKYMPQGGDFVEFGGVKGKNHRGILPTGETAQYILGGIDYNLRLKVANMLQDEAYLVKEGILYLETVPEGEPMMSGKLVMAQDYVDFYLTGKRSKPKFSSNFPAREIFTEMDWEDLVLSKDVLEQIQELQIWLNHHTKLFNDWGLARKLKPGYRTLFHGPSGTGKTLTATLLGKHTGKPVFRVDLSTVVSKYIGETEKNLERLFTKARNRDWILFFDEADAIFGKRTGVKDAHDRFANQEVSYLLQRVEDFDGLVILSSNFKSNIDDAFLRRFNSIIKFPFPTREERKSIAQKGFPVEVKFEENLDIPEIISGYELSGGNIMNVVQFSCLQAIEGGDDVVLQDMVLKGIRREIEKEGKMFHNKSVG